MKIRTHCLIGAVVALGLGVLLYVLFRPPTVALAWLPLRAPFAGCAFWGSDCIRYFLPDALWSCALSFSFFALYLPSGKQGWAFALLAFGFGCFWEGLQYSGYISGTGDIWDMVAYGVGSCSALGIYFYWKRRIL